MTAHRSRRWFQLSLKSLFLLVLLMATFLAGYSLATKHADEAMRAEHEARRLAEAESRQTAEALRQAGVRNAIDLAVLKALSGEAGDPTILTVK